VTQADWQIGPADARVTLIVYTDFQGPASARLAAVLSQIRAEFPDDVRLVFRHFALVGIHDKAQLAAEAAEAAGAQGKFWEMHDLLFQTQSAWANLALTDFRALLDGYAGQLGLDTQQFAADLDAGKYAARVETATNTALLVPILQAPFLLFNGLAYAGPVAHWAFATQIKLEKLKDRQYDQSPPEVIDPFRTYLATLHTSQGEVELDLFAEKAPLTVNNFVFLARAGWYDGVPFHAVLPDYVLTGDPSGTGFGGPGYLIPDEINPDLLFDAPGKVGMANTGPDTNGSQFFITLQPRPDLNGRWTLFGRVTRGLEVLSRLAPRNPESDPEAPLRDFIDTVTIEEK
jgi:cyclophilin family peptidyl-prolyl cis-trans isomerase